MPNSVKFSIYTLFFSIAIFMLILFIPNKVSKKINDFFINKALQSLPEEFDYTDVSGNFLQGFTIYNTSIIKDDIDFSAREIYINPDLSKIMFNNIVISKLKINNGHIITNHINNSNITPSIKKIFLKNNYEITNLELNDISVINNDKLFKINGNIRFIFGKKIHFDFNDLEFFSPRFNSPIVFQDGIIIYKPNFLDINGLKIKSNYLNGLFNLSINLTGKPKYLFNIIIDDINYISETNSVNIENIVFNNKEKLYLSANHIFYNNLIINDLHYGGYIDNGLLNGTWNFFESNKIQSGTMTVEIAKSLKDIKINIGNALDNNLNFKKIFTKIESTNLFKTSILNVSIENLLYKNIFYHDIKSKINLVNYFNIDTGFVNVKSSDFKTKAFIKKLNSNLFDIYGKISFNQIDISKYMNDFNGYVHGESNYKIKFKNMNDYHMKLISKINNIKINDLIINDLMDSTHVINHLNQFNMSSQGTMSSMEVNDLKWYNLPYRGVINDTLSNFNVDYNDSSGNHLNLDITKIENSYFVDNFTTSINNMSLRINPFKIDEKKHLLNFDGIEGSLNDGHFTLSGNYKNNVDYNIKMTATKLDIEKIKKILNKKNNISGIIHNGYLLIEKNKTFNTFFHSKINIINGKINHMNFDSLNINSNYRDNRIIFSDLAIYKGKGQLNGNGWLNLNEMKKNKIDEMDFFINFNNFNIKEFKSYFPSSSIESKGMLSGNFKVAGLRESITIYGDFIIDEPMFDKIAGESLNGKILYEKNRLYLNELNFNTIGGNYTGVGNFPIRSNNLSNKSISDNKFIDFTLTGKSNNLNIFSPYLANIDSINGTHLSDSTFSMLLDISGDLDNPIRNGKLICNDATIYLEQFNNPITNIKCNLTLTDNILNIYEFKGKSKKNIDHNIFSNFFKKINGLLKNNNKDINNDIFTTGKIDLNSFFKPRYDLNITSKEVHLESSYDNFQGSGALNLSVKGKDTIMVTGTFLPSPNDFVITNYNTNYEYLDDKILTNYRINLNIPFDNGIEINTANANIFVDGDLTLSNNEINQYVFSGRINFIDGRYYDDQGNHYENISGQLVLSPDDKFSHIDLHATTHILNSLIDVSIMGSPNNPQIYFSDQEGQYNQTQILTLLTFGSPEINLENNFSNVENLVSNYIENKIERNIADMATLDEFHLNSSESFLNSINSKDDLDLKLILGKRISKNIYLNSHIDFYDFDDNEYEAEYRLSPNSSLIGGINTNDGNNSFHVKYRIKYYY